MARTARRRSAAGSGGRRRRSREGRILTVQFGLATVVNLLVSLVFFMLMVVMAVYAVDRFGVSEPEAGLAASVFVIGALAVRPFAGRFLDVVGRRRVLVAGLVVFTVAGALYVPADRFELLVGVRLLHGAGLGAAHTAITASVMSVLPVARRAEGMGYFTMSGNVATATGPLLALAVVRAADHATLFRLAAALAAVALGLALALRLPAPPRDRMAPRAVLALRPADFVERRVLPVAAMMLLVGVAFSGVVTFVDGYASGNGLGAEVGAFFVVYSGVILVSRLFVGRIHDTRGDNVVVYPALVAVAVGLVVLATVTTAPGLLTAGALLGLGTGTLISSSHVIAVSISPAHRVGLATSTFFVMLDLGTGIGPVLLGLVIARWDAATMYAGLAGLVVMAAGVYHVAHGRAVRAERRRPRPSPGADVCAPVTTA